MAVVKDIFRILKNGIWDEHHFRTSADQVFYTKEDGTASNVQKELAAQNSTLAQELFPFTNCNPFNIQSRRLRITSKSQF